MSFVIAAPELIESAAHDLAGIGSTLGEATEFAAAPTTSIAAAGTDEISVAIAALFGSHGQQFQALSAKAAAFHEEFVGLMKSGAGAYLSTEVANAEQTLGGAFNAPAQTLGGGGGAVALAHVTEAAGGAVTPLQSGGAASLLTGRTGAGVQAISGVIANASAELKTLETSAQALFSPSNLAAIEAPYQSLFSTTAANLQILRSAISANPSPVLHQIISNELGYAQTIGTGFVHAVQNLPAELANVPADIQTGFHALSAVNPEALVQHFINNQIGYAQTISTSLQAAAHDFTAGLHALPASFQTAFGDLAAGNTTGAVGALESGFDNLFITGFNTTLGAGGVLSVTPTGTLGDLLPILSIPGQMAQNFANLFPAGSLAAHLSQNFANLVKTVTDSSLTATASFYEGGGGLAGGGIDINTAAGLPLVLAIDALGGPVNALHALGASAHTITSALQTGNLVGAVDGLLDAPANVVNGFLNGQTTMPLSTVVFGIWPSTLDIPVDGILVPAAPYTGTVPAVTWANLAVTGTPIGGILPDLLTDVPAELAAALGGPPAPVIPLA
jgi:PE family